MKENDETQTPMLVRNPKTGKYIDLNPFWEMLNEEYGTVTEVAEVIDNAIRYISLWVTPDDGGVYVDDHRAAIYNLYCLRDAFRDMVKFKEGGE